MCSLVGRAVLLWNPRPKKYLVVHIFRRYARLVEGSFTDDAKLLRIGIVIDDGAGAGVVEAGLADEIEHGSIEIGAGAREKVHVRRHAREIGEVAATLVGSDVLQNEGGEHERVSLVADVVSISAEVVYLFRREHAAPVDHRREVVPFHSGRNGFQVRKIPLTTPCHAECQHAVRHRHLRAAHHVGVSRRTIRSGGGRLAPVMSGGLLYGNNGHNSGSSLDL